jgi:hypothetical protein
MTGKRLVGKRIELAGRRIGFKLGIPISGVVSVNHTRRRASSCGPSVSISRSIFSSRVTSKAYHGISGGVMAEVALGAATPLLLVNQI